MDDGPERRSPRPWGLPRTPGRAIETWMDLGEPRIGPKLIVGSEPPSADPDTLRPRVLEADVRGGG